MNPCLLLVEDDAVTAAFLAQALAPLPVRLVVAADLAQARGLADGSEALWLFDAYLPDGRGDDLLGSLRARGWQVPALALTAEDDPGVLAGLRAAGFVAVLAKPIGAAALREAVAAAMANQASVSARSTWDDAAALSALGGEPGAVRELRRLFLRELPVQAGLIAAAWSARDEARLGAQLHRLKASCAFVGAAGLLDSARALHAAPTDASAHSRFQADAAAILSDAPQS
ncbi:hybrid sensor histidine kinase/response regulator [Arenimonas sp.]|uniref:hybrid sensor histidine kinase/response regulator n=1 Tax=Arenimonas sp. TaxID=1872635 RepID=UPI0025C5B4E4|nr:hybrid sensor histidine kinase/response regulator [Arenimonas sp.]